jgi:hypothetical protein
MTPLTNLRAEIFEELLALNAELGVAGKKWKKHCSFTERLYRESATKLGRIIASRRDDASVCRILEEVGNALVLHGTAAIFPEARRESYTFACRTLNLLPSSASLMLAPPPPTI